MDQDIACGSCNSGVMVRAKVRRRHGVVVFLGFLLLIPSILGVGVGIIVVASTGMIASQAEKTPEEAKADLERAEVPGPLIEKAMAGESLTQDELRSLSPKQAIAVQIARLAGSGKELATTEARVVGLIMTALFALGVVVGWRLILKKWILRCTQCRAAIPLVHSVS